MRRLIQNTAGLVAGLALVLGLVSPAWAASVDCNSKLHCNGQWIWSPLLNSLWCMDIGGPTLMACASTNCNPCVPDSCSCGGSAGQACKCTMGGQGPFYAPCRTCVVLDAQGKPASFCCDNKSCWPDCDVWVSTSKGTAECLCPP